MSELSERIREARKALGWTAAESAKRAGLARTSWEKYERGEAEPKASVLLFLASHGIASEWLLSGQGAMMSNQGGADEWLMSRVVDGIQRTYKEVGAGLPSSSLGELAARIHNEIVQLDGGEEAWRGALALALGRLKAELTEAATTGTGKSSASF